MRLTYNYLASIVTLISTRRTTNKPIDKQVNTDIHTHHPKYQHPRQASSPQASTSHRSASIENNESSTSTSPARPAAAGQGGPPRASSGDGDARLRVQVPKGGGLPPVPRSAPMPAWAGSRHSRRSTWSTATSSPSLPCRPRAEEREPGRQGPRSWPERTPVHLPRWVAITTLGRGAAIWKSAAVSGTLGVTLRLGASVRARPTSGPALRGPARPRCFLRGHLVSNPT